MGASEMMGETADPYAENNARSGEKRCQRGNTHLTKGHSLVLELASYDRALQDPLDQA